jgi:hypothetical protein
MSAVVCVSLWLIIINDRFALPYFARGGRRAKKFR